jgi:hypothetical protein
MRVQFPSVRYTFGETMSQPTQDQMLKAAASYLQGDWDDADGECIAAIILHWVKSQGLTAVNVEKSPWCKIEFHPATGN